jgi:glutathione peroxidase
MIKKILYISILIGLSMFPFFKSSSKDKSSEISAYDFSFTNLTNSNQIHLKDFEGSVILIVNTASNCGLTSQYEGLEKLYKHYKEKGLVIIGVPSNDFGKQEPGSSQEIQNFCQINYGVTFPMTSKQVVSGDNAHPFYLWAKKTLGFGTAPKWNFHKYLINRKGELINYFNSTTSPDSDNIKKNIETALEETN